MKYYKKDIKIKSEGKQLKKRILEKYTIKELAKKTNLYETSINTYLRKPKIDVQSFIVIIENIFNMSYSNLINTYDNQIKSLIYNIRDNIFRYDEEKDIEVFKALLKLINKKECLYYYVILLSCLGRYKQNIGCKHQSINIINTALQIAKNNNYHDLYIYSKFDLSFIYFQHKDFDNAYMILNSIENKYIKFAEKNFHILEHRHSLYKYYYFNGILLREKKDYIKSTKMFKKALKYINNDDQISKVFNNIALNYFAKKDYDIAIKCFEKALKHSNEEVECSIYGNLANMYCEQKKIIQAKTKILKALSIMKKDMSKSLKLDILITFIKITLLENNKNKNKVIIETLNKVETKEIIINLINYISNYCKKTHDMVLLNNLVNVLENNIDIKQDISNQNCFKIAHSEILLFIKNELVR